MRVNRYVKVISGALLACSVLGCASYYRVTDPSSGQVYHTRKYNRRGSGSVVFKDAKTGADITLQSSEVARISKYEFEKGTHD